MAEPLTGANLPLNALRQHVRPGRGDEPWREIPWIPDLWQGARVARARKRPLFIWAMNGHPLGCV